MKKKECRKSRESVPLRDTITRGAKAICSGVKIYKMALPNQIDFPEFADKFHATS